MIRRKSESGACRIWKSQCAISTCGLPRSLQNTVADSIVLYPSGFNLPNKAARLIADMSSLPYHLRLSILLRRRGGRLGAHLRRLRRVPVRQMPSVGVRIVGRILVGEAGAKP